MKKLYRRRRDALKRSLFHYFSKQVKISGDSTGMHLIAEFDGIKFSPVILERVEQQRVRVYPMSAYTLFKEKHQQQVLLGYGNLEITDIKMGIQRLKLALS